MPNYMVVGIYADNGQRFASSYEAADADEAERLAHDEAEGGDLEVAAVFLELGDDRLKLVQ